MRVTQTVKELLDWCEGDNPGLKTNTAWIPGIGKVAIMPANMDKSMTTGMKDVPQPGRAAIGFTIYPGEA